ncbi:MAG: dihydrolipoyllysine-residue acetyltransferase [Parahaliea sp.]
MTKQIVKVPDIGGAESAEVIELLVTAGDELAVDQSIIVLESDKASMEIPSSHAGRVVEVLVSVGEELSEGHDVLVLETTTAEAAAENVEITAGMPVVETVAEPGPVHEPTVVAAPQVAMEIIVPVPDIGTSDGVDLIEISVKVGDTVAEGDSLLVLESDKASMEVPSPNAGEILEILVSEDSTVRQGDALLRLKTVDAVFVPSVPITPVPATAASPSPAEKTVAPAVSSPSPGNMSVVPASISKSSGDVYAGPAVRLLARDLGVALEDVMASGPRGRILKEDVHNYVKEALTSGPKGGGGIIPVPEVDYASFGEVDVVARTRMDKVTADNMQRNWLNLPHVTQFDEADITELEDFRKGLKAESERRGIRLTPLPFLLKACAVALRDNPKFNASLSADGESLVYKRYSHIGMAVDTPVGLLVPVLRDVDRKTLWELAAEIVELAERARNRKLKPQDMQGACFTISSLGAIGGTGFTPIINAPEVGILGVSRAEIKPKWDGSSFQPRMMLPLALSYDHRVINGGDAGRFCTQLVGLLSDIRKLLM